MTVVAAGFDGQGQAHIACDRLVELDGYRIAHVPKIVRSGDWAIGIAGDMRTTNLVNHYREALFEGTNDAQVIVDRVRQMLIDDGYAASGEDSGVREYGQELIIAHRSRVWTVSPCFAVMPAEPDTVVAIGSGRDYALGAGFAGSQQPLHERVLFSVCAAIRWDVHCGGEPLLVSLGAS